MGNIHEWTKALKAGWVPEYTGQPHPALDKANLLLQVQDRILAAIRRVITQRGPANDILYTAESLAKSIQVRQLVQELSKGESKSRFFSSVEKDFTQLKGLIARAYSKDQTLLEADRLAGTALGLVKMIQMKLN